MAKFVIAIKEQGFISARYFVNLNSNGEYWQTENKKRAMKFETFDAAVNMYYRIDERAKVLNQTLMIVEY